MKNLIAFLLLIFCQFLPTNAAAGCSVTPVNDSQYPLSGPGGRLAATADERYVFVADEGAGNINIIDTADKVMIKRISTGGRPFDMAMNTAAGRLYVSDYSSGVIYVLDVKGKAADFTLLDSHPVNADALGPLAYDPVQNRIYTVDARNNLLTLAADDLSEASPLLAAMDESGRITQMLIADGKLYMSNAGGNTIEIYDINSSAPVRERSILVSSRPMGLALSADGGILYVANNGGNMLTLIDTVNQVETKTVESATLLDSPMGLAHMDDKIWITNLGKKDNLAGLDTAVNELSFSNICDKIGASPTHVLALPGKSEVYVSHNAGINVMYVPPCGDLACTGLTAWVRQGDADTYTRMNEILAEPKEVFDLRIEGGSGRFDITATGGMGAATTDDERVRKVTASPLDGPQILSIQDLSSNETLRLIVYVGGKLTLSPDGPIAKELGGLPEFLSASGGFPPYRWRVNNGFLSSTTAQWVTYTPRVIGEDLVTLRDNAGREISLTIFVTVSGISITPATAVMLAGETREFTALGGTDYEWQAPLGGTVSQTTGESTVYTAPPEIGDYSLALTNVPNNDRAQAIIHVIREDIRISPAMEFLDRNAPTVFSVSGGFGPYTWSSQYGDLSANKGDFITYTAPKIAVMDTVTVSDSGGRMATARVDISGELLISPVTAVVSRGEEISFTLNGATGEVGWQTTSGAETLKDKSMNSVHYIAPEITGRHTVTAADAGGAMAHAVVFVVSNEFVVSPAKLPLAEKAVGQLTAQGGIGPYLWAAEMGALSATEGKILYFTAPDNVLENSSRTMRVTVEDSQGRLATTEITVIPTNCGHLAYDHNCNGILERTELYEALDAFLNGNLGETDIEELIIYFFTGY
ncbi:MAG: hypothetical protein GY862_21160 [Gammaproteobacteria bacterium]|nr:hypothetical protein [Gammaproteobacteria bacterium]